MIYSVSLYYFRNDMNGRGESVWISRFNAFPQPISPQEMAAFFFLILFHLICFGQGAALFNAGPDNHHISNVLKLDCYTTPLILKDEQRNAWA